jgi:PAS domain S-box-containing protein
MVETLTCEKLSQNVERLEALIRNSQLATAQLSVGNIITDINPEFTRIFGFEREDAVGKHVDSIITPPEYREEAEELTRRTMKGETIHKLTKRKRKDGTLVDVEIFAGPLRVNGQVLGAYGQYKDITEQKQAEKALQESEEKYKNIFDNAQVGLFRTRISDGKVLECNDRYARIVGYPSRAACIGDYIASQHYVDPSSRQRMLAEIQEDGEVSNFEADIEKKDGSIIWARYSARIYPERGYLEGVLVDITEEKRAAGALLESKKRYRAVVEDMPAMICRFLPDGILTFVNSAYCEYFGKKKRELLGENFFQFIPQEDQEKVRAQFKSLNLKEPMITYEHRVDAPTGEVRWQQWTDRALFDEKGEVTEYQSIGRDITDLKGTEEALRQSDSQKRAILDASIDRIRLVDKDMRIIWANKTTTRELSVTSEDITGRVCYELLFGRDAPCPGCPTIKALQTGEFERAVMHQHEAAGIKGETYWEDYAVPIKDESGEIVSLIQVTRNITERVKAEKEKKGLEAQLLQAQKMEAIGTLAGGIAHDFNNLLMGIQGNASLMLLGMDTTHPHCEKLKSVEQYVINGAELSRQLLGLARGGKYEVKPTNLNDIIEKSSEIFGRTRKEITIYRKLPKDIWPVEMDRGQIEQVLLNLYVNAWQSMPSGGDLYLQTENVELDESHTQPFGTEPGRFVKTSVMDTGTGMDKATQERIFEPFFTTKEMGRGTGLGLASAWGIIKNHGGLIEVYSEKGNGSTFNIYLPACEKQVERAKASSREILQGQETILLVDDEEMILNVGKEMLERMGYKALLAKGGVEALEIYSRNQHQVHLIILDMIMPNMGGGETFEKLKALNPEIKVILSSGYSLEGQATEIMKRGCDGFIQKPFNINDLSNNLRLILEDYQA